MKAVKEFYNLASTGKEIQGKLSRLKISADDLTAATKLISDLETARAI